jgi:hypothetical protein
VGASIAAAAWTATLAQAATLAIAVALTSWAIDAAEGFAALAWLGGASAWSLEQKLAPFEKGILPVGPVLWLSIATIVAVTLAVVGTSFDRRPAVKWIKGLAVLVVGALLLSGTTGVRRAYDWTEERRASLPPAVVEGLRAIDRPIAIDVYLDRDDSRRHQLESDVLTKLILARPDVVVRTPLDSSTVTEAQRDADYGRLIVHAGEGERETRSTSRKEVVTLVFEAAGRPVPDWEQPAYPGFPIVLGGAARRSLVICAYLVVPVLLLVIGLYLSQRRTTR